MSIDLNFALISIAVSLLLSAHAGVFTSSQLSGIATAFALLGIVSLISVWGRMLSEFIKKFSGSEAA